MAASSSGIFLFNGEMTDECSDAVDIPQRAGFQVNYEDEFDDDNDDDNDSDSTSTKKADTSDGNGSTLGLDDFLFANERESSMEGDDHLGGDDFLYGSTPPRQIRSERRHNNKGNSKGAKPPKLVLPLPKKDSKKDKSFGQAKKSLAKKMDSVDSAQSGLNTKQKFHQRRMRNLHLDRTSEREMKQKAITYDGADLHPPSTPTYIFRPYDSLPSPNLKIGSSTCFRSVKSQQVSPPPSPGSKTKKHSSSSSKMQYALERVEFHRTFSALIRMGSAKKESSQESQHRIRRQDGMAQDMFQMQWNEILWLELTAYHNDLTIDEQDSCLVENRKEASVVLEEIMNFQFQSALSNQAGKSKCPLDRRRASLKSAQRNQVKLSSGNSNTSSSSSQGESVDAPSVNGSVCDTCYTPGHKRQPSLSDNVTCMPLSTALNSYITDTCDAWRKVNTLLKKLEQIQALYPTTKSLQNDCPLYGREEFTRRVETLCLWMNLTNDISHKFDLTAQILGVVDLDTLWWPCLNLPGYYVEDEYLDDNETDLCESDKPMVKPTARRPMLGALGHWNCVQSSSHDMPPSSLQGTSCDTQSTSLSNDRADSRDLLDGSIHGYSSDRADSRDLLDGSIHGEPALPDSSLDDHTFDDQRDDCSEVSFGSSRSSIYSNRSFKRTRSVTFNISDSLPSEEQSRRSPEVVAEPEPQMSSTPQSKSPRSEESPRINRIFSECHFSFDYDSSTSMYRPFVDRSLKHQGLRKMTKRLDRMLGHTMRKLRPALDKASEDIPDNRRISTGSETDMTLRIPQFFNTPCPSTELTHPTLQTHGAWSKEFQKMNLPTFMPAYLFLVRIPLDVMHECLRFRLEHKPEADPSQHSIQQLIRECKEVIGACTHVKQYYHDMLSAVMSDDARAQEHVDNDIDEYENDLQEMLKVYFEYVHSWMLMLQRLPQASISLKNILEEEWAFAKEMCPCVRGGEAQAGKIFCIMASNLLQSTGEYLESRVDDVCVHLQDSQSISETTKRVISESCRMFKQLFHEVRDRAAKALGFAKMLSKDLEIASEFSVNTSMVELIHTLKKSGHVKVLLSSFQGYQVFVPQHLHNNPSQILHLLNDLCGREDFLNTTDPTSPDDSDGYLLLVRDDEGEVESMWLGDTTSVNPNIETTIATSDVQVDSILLVVNHSSQLMKQRKAFQRAMGNTVTLVNEMTSSHNTIAEALEELKDNALDLCHKIVRAISQVEENLNLDSILDVDEPEKINTFASYFRDTMCHCFSVGFEYHKEVSRLLANKQGLGESILNLADKWMNFVLKKCERGKGRRPRWANQGLEFLILACEPRNNTHLEEKEFQNLQQLMRQCIQHVIGTQGKTNPASPVRVGSPSIDKMVRVSTRSNKSSRTSSSSESITSPTGTGDLRRIPSLEKFLSLVPNTSPTDDRLDPGFPRYDKRVSPNPSACSSPQIGHSRVFRTLSKDTGSSSGPQSRRDHKIRAIEQLEHRRNAHLQEKHRIGRVSDRQSDHEVVNINCKKVTFRWQRGFKIGEGQFGTTVYSCINMNTGETLAVKEMRFQRNDHQVIRDIADEIKNLEGIRHPNLVRYYGVEIHREELLIFMEYCDEGTIAEVAKTGLPEEMIRQYTREVTKAINELHEHNIIHRDIKGANIFLSSDGHVKLGDFGAAIKLKTHTTMHGEVNTTMGTAAYMAPEVITQSGKGKQGYGRAADIWSLGCVVIEMATGKRPWHDYDHEYTIMYKVGEGATPHIPEHLGAEGRDFLTHCLQHDASRRWTANKLLDHPFIKVAHGVIEEENED